MITKNQLIQEWLKNYGIKNYSIIKGIVNVHTFVDLSNKDLNEIPVQFGKISGDFNCSNNNLKSLKGVPSIVLGSFNCSYNNLNSLEYYPTFVSEFFDCSHNKIENLDVLSKLICKSLDISSNQIKELKNLPQIIKGSFYCNNNQIEELKNLPQIIKGSFYFHNNPLKILENFHFGQILPIDDIIISLLTEEMINKIHKANKSYNIEIFYNNQEINYGSFLNFLGNKQLNGKLLRETKITNKKLNNKI